MLTRRALWIVLVWCVASWEAHAECYALPFANPNLRRGWGASGHGGRHRGLDFPQPKGTPISSVADGIVVARTRTPCLGHVVVIAHADGVFSGYAHMSARSQIREGTRVERGEIVGFVGATGSCATGPHLHLTIAPTKDGYLRGESYDPYAYIRARQTPEHATTRPSSERPS